MTSSRPPLPAPHRVLVIRLSSIGDVVLTTPLLRRLRASFPACEIHFVTRAPFAPMVDRHPAITAMHTLPAHPALRDVFALRMRLRSMGFDVVFDLHNNPRSRILRFGVAPRVFTVRKRALARALLIHLHEDVYRDAAPVPVRYIETAAAYGITPDSAPPEFVVPESIVDAIDMRMAGDAGGKTVRWIALCPGAKHNTKRWPEENWLVLAQMVLNAPDVEIAVFGGPEDAPLGAALTSLAPSRIHSYCGVLTLAGSAAAFSHCSAAVTNDSGLMHIATARGVPVVALFGSTVRQFGFFPYNAPSRVLEVEGLRCRPCTHIGRDACPEGHFRCMRDITPEAVHVALSELRLRSI